MKPKITLGSMSVFLLATVLMFAGCASHSYIPVRYQLPLASGQLAGQTVSLTFKDLRGGSSFLSESAEKSFKDFSGLFSLYLVEGSESEKLLGAYDVAALFTEAFSRRLQRMGVAVARETAGGPAVELGLKAFSLDYQGRKWIMTVGFQVRLSTAEGRTVTESISSSGERMKIVGKGDAQKFLSEMFSESLNKFDVYKLFRQAGL